MTDQDHRTHRPLKAGLTLSGLLIGLIMGSCSAAPPRAVAEAPAEPARREAVAPAARLAQHLEALQQDFTDRAAFRGALQAALHLNTIDRLLVVTEALKSDLPDEPLVIWYHAATLIEVDEARGEAALEACVERFPENTPCLMAQAHRAAERGHEATAMITLERALDTDDEEILALTAEVHWRADAEQFDRAARAAATLTRLAPDDPETLVAQGHLSLARKAHDVATAYLERARKRAPDHADAWFYQARVAMDQGQATRSISWLEGALARNPRFHRARAVLGHMLLSQSRAAEAEAHFRALIERFPTHSDYAVALSQALIAQRRFESALGWADELLGRRPGHIEGTLARLTALVGLGRITEALELRPALYDDDHRAPEHRLTVARTLAEAGQQGWAEAEYADLIESHPEYQGGWRAYGRWHYNGRRFDTAVGVFQRAVKHHPDAPLLHFDLADALEEAGARSEGRKSMARAARLDPTDPDYEDELARMEYMDGDVEDALARWKRLIEQHPDATRAMRRLSQALLKADRPAEAIPVLQQLVQLAPEDAGVRAWLGEAQARTSALDQAAHTLEIAHKLGAAETRVVPLLALIYAEKGEIKKARAAFDRALALDPSSRPVRMAYGWFLTSVGDTSAAAQQYRARLARDPQDDQARLALEVLIAADPEAKADVAAVLSRGAAASDPILGALVERAPDVKTAPAAVVLRDERYVTIDDRGLAAIKHVRSVLIRDASGAARHKTVKVAHHARRPPKLLTARTLTPDGEILKVAPEGLRTVNPFAGTRLFGEARRLEITFPEVEPGAIIDYEVIVPRPMDEGLAAWWDSYLLGNGDPTVQVRYGLTLPADRPWTADADGLGDAHVEVADGQRRMVWSGGPLPAYRAGDDIPGVHVSSLPSWAEVDTWYTRLYAPAVHPDPVVAAYAARVTAKAKTRREKVAAIYRAVESRVEYLGLEIGEGAYRPRPAGSTLAREAGDCKDMTALMAAMLEAQGIQALPALIRPRDQTTINRAHPSPAQFSHVVLYVPDGADQGGDLWLDATARLGTVAAVPDTLRGRTAFIVNGQGGHLATVPAGQAEDHRLETWRSYDLSFTGGGRLDMRWKATGDLAGAARQRFSDLNAEQRREQMARPGFLLGGTKTVQSSTVSGLEDPMGPLEITASHHHPDLVGVQLNGGLVVPLDLDLLSHSPLSEWAAGTRFLLPRTIVRHLEITPPEGYQPNWLPLSLNEVGPGFTLKVSERREAGRIFIDATLQITEAGYEPYSLPLVQLGLRRARSGVAERLVALPGADFDQARFLAAILVDRPEDDRLRRMLGRLQLDANDYEAAVATLNPLDKANAPVEDQALYATALMSNGQLEEAEAVFARASARPDAPAVVFDAWAGLRLARSLPLAAVEAVRLGLARYPEEPQLSRRHLAALIAAERSGEAMALAQRLSARWPDDAGLYQTLGQLAAETGDTAAAEVAYRSALRLSPDAPEILSALATLMRDDAERRQEALSLAHKATRLDPRNVLAWDTLAHLWFEAGRPLKALKAIRKAEALNPEGPYGDRERFYRAHRRVRRGR